MAIEIDYYITMVSKIMSLVNATKSVRPKVLGAKPKQAGKKGEIRYERKSIIFLWIAVFGFMLHHHPDNIDQLTAQADQGLRFCFALGYFSFEIPSGRVIARP